MVERACAAVDAGSAFDPSILDEFCATVGPAAPALVRGIVQVYLSETPQTIALVRAALEAHERQRAANLLHRMRGGSLSIGAVRMAQACGRLEHCIAEDTALRSIVTLVDEFTLAATALETYLAERQAR